MTPIPDKQLRLPFPPPKESRAEKADRLLSGKLGYFVKPASELMFNYDQATKAATTRRVQL